MSLLDESAATGRPDVDEPSLPSVCVQLVVYRQDFRPFLRTVLSVAAAATRAVDEGAIGAFAVVIGDSSDRPCLTEEQRNGLRRHVEEAGGEFGYVFFAANLGSAGGSNRLRAAHDADLAFVLNPDTYLHPRAICALVNAMESKVGIVEGRQLPLEHPKVHDPVTGETSWASGACMLVRTACWDEVGGFDDDHFFLHCDDVDFSWRVRSAGWRVVHAPRAVVQHDKRITLTGGVETPPIERYHGALGRLLLLTRYGQHELIEQTVAAIEERQDDQHVRALREFERRRDRGDLPDELDAATVARVAEFTSGHYARHRF